MKLLIDTNVLVDFLATREPFFRSASVVWDLVEENAVQAVVSAVSFATVSYLSERYLGRENGASAIRRVHKIFKVATVNQHVIDRAIEANWPDFEDALQMFSGLDTGATHIVTRDSAGFRNSPIPIIAPEAVIKEILKPGR